MKKEKLIRKDLTHRIDKRPALKWSYFFWEGKMAFTGSILRRPLKEIKGFHYAFIYGYDKNQTLWLIENNNDGVECVTLRDFKSHSHTFDIVHYELTPDRGPDIIERAIERSAYGYLMQANNCEHFANYCVHERLESFQVDEMKKVVNDIITLVFERKAYNDEDPKVKKYREQINKIRKSVDDFTNPHLIKPPPKPWID